MSLRTVETESADVMMSPSSFKFLDECPAGYLYNKHLLPLILDSLESETITKCGSMFHDWAETGFDASKKADICDGADEDDILAIDQYAERVKSRWYFSEATFEVEKYVKMRIRPTDRSWLLRGYIDRVVRVGDIWYIIDYKTTWNPNPYGDVRQLRIYAYLIHHLFHVKAENLKLILDYVQEDAMYPFDVSETDLVLTGNYVMNGFLRAQATIDEYAKTKDMRLIYHRPGSMCTFCHMNGNCLAYKAYHNPAFTDPDQDASMSLADIVTELQLRQEAVKINEGRVTMLKRTLMQMINEADAKNDTKLKNDIFSKVSLRSRKDKFIPRDQLLERLIPEIVKDGFKRQQMKGMFDTQKLEKKFEQLMAAYLPDSLKLSQIPKEVLDEHKDLIKTVQRNKYIQVG